MRTTPSARRFPWTAGVGGVILAIVGMWPDAPGLVLHNIGGFVCLGFCFAWAALALSQLCGRDPSALSMVAAVVGWWVCFNAGAGLYADTAGPPALLALMGGVVAVPLGRAWGDPAGNSGGGVVARLVVAVGLGFALWSLWLWCDVQLWPELARRDFFDAAFGYAYPGPSLWADRNVLPLGHANFNGGVVAVFLPVMVALAVAERHRWWRAAAVAGGVAMVGVLFSSGSRAGVLGLMLGAGAAVPWLWRRVDARVRRWVPVLAVIPVVVVVHPRTRATLADPASLLSSDAERWELVKTGWRLFCEKPWFGHGAGSLPQVYPHAWSGDGVLNTAWQLHVTPLQLAVEHGVFVALAWLAIPVLVWRGLRRTTDVLRTGLWSSVLAYWGCGWFDYQLNVVFISLSFGLVLGAALAPESTGAVGAAVAPGWRRRAVSWLASFALVAPLAVGSVRFALNRRDARDPASAETLQTTRVLLATSAIAGDDAAAAWTLASRARHPDDLVSQLAYALAAMRTGRMAEARAGALTGLRLNPQSGAAWRVAALVLENSGRGDAALRARAALALIEPASWLVESDAARRAASDGAVAAALTELRGGKLSALQEKALARTEALARHVREHGGRFVSLMSFPEGEAALAPLREAAATGDARKLRALGYFARRLYDDAQVAALAAHLSGKRPAPVVVTAVTFGSYNLMAGTLEAPAPVLPVAVERDLAHDLIWPCVAPIPGQVPGAWLRARAESLFQ